MDAEGMPERVMTEKRLTPEQYIDNLANVLMDAKEEGLCHGRLTKTPKAVQKSLLAEVMKAAGFCSTKCISYCCTKAQKELEQLRVDEDEDV